MRRPPESHGDAQLGPRACMGSLKSEKNALHFILRTTGSVSQWPFKALSSYLLPRIGIPSEAALPSPNPGV